MERTVRELDQALDQASRASAGHRYDSAYYGEGRDPLDRMGLSGYERYDRDSSNADAAAYLVWKWFDVHRVLDVGCALGFVVEAMRELGLDAQGVDVSRHAVTHAALGARGHLHQGSLTERLPVRKGAFDLVTVFETLEHLPPEAIPGALRELRRVTRGYVVATIPSFGPNEHGPGGWFEGKVRPDRLDHYRSLGSGYEGPVPFEDLARDARGEPVEGHLTIASFAWWTRRFEEAGLVRCGTVERCIHPDLARFGLTKYWNLYVLRRPDVAEPTVPARRPEELAERERLWKLDTRVADPEDLEALRAVLGETGATG